MRDIPEEWASIQRTAKTKKPARRQVFKVSTELKRAQWNARWCEAGIEPFSLLLKIKGFFSSKIFLPLCVPSLGLQGYDWNAVGHSVDENIPGVFSFLVEFSQTPWSNIWSGKRDSHLASDLLKSKGSFIAEAGKDLILDLFSGCTKSKKEVNPHHAIGFYL